PQPKPVRPAPVSPPPGGAQGLPARAKLSDLITNTDRRRLASAWRRTEAAGEFAPLPSGKYVAHIINGAPGQSRHGTPGYKLTFEVAEGEHAGRLFWHDIWFTEAAVPMAKRDLGKLGVPVDNFNAMVEQLEQPLPQGIRCSVRLALRMDDAGQRFN